MCIKCGVDYMGLNFYLKSQRFIDVNKASALISGMSRGSDSKVAAVFVNAGNDQISECLDLCPEIGVVQLHGEEATEQVVALRESIGPDTEIWKAIKVAQQSDVAKALSWDEYADLVLLDGVAPGSGKAFDWEVITSDLSKIRWGLAGGINLSNIQGALKLKPALIDLASGVESSPGVKDFDKIQEILRVVRN